MLLSGNLTFLKQLEELDYKICNSDNLSNIDDILNEYESLKIEMQTRYEEKGCMAIFRSKYRWVEKGERPTRYFFNLEKQNYNRKTITELQTDNNDIIKEKDNILETIEIFYEDLYSSKTTVSQVDFDEFQSLIMKKRTNWEGFSLWKNVRRC